MRKRLVILSVLVGATLTQALAGQDFPNGRRVPGLLCAQASDEDFKKLDPATRLRWDNSYPVYRKWLKHVEVVEFLASSEENQTFLTSARNVTSDDEVFLRVRRTNPLLYTYVVKLDRSDTAPEELLTITGAPVTAFNPFDIQATVADAKEKNDAAGELKSDTAADANLTARTTSSVIESFSQVKLVPPAAQVSVRTNISEAQNYFAAGYRSLEQAREQRTKYFDRIAAVRTKTAALLAELEAVTDDLVGLERLRCLGDPLTCAEQLRAMVDGPGRRTLTHLLSEVAAVARDISALSSVPGEIDRALERAEAALENGRDALRRAAAPDGTSPTSPDETILENAIERERRIVEGAAERVRALQTSVSDVRGELAEIRDAIGAALQRAVDADVCLALGRFPAQTTVSLTIELTKRAVPETRQKPNFEKLTELARSLFTEVEKARTGNPQASTTRSADGKKPETEKPTAATENPKSSGAQSATTTFHVLQPVHVQTTLGYGTSLLAAPEFDFRSRTLEEVRDASGAVVSPAMKEITPFALDQNERQLVPMVQLGLHVKTRYPFAGADSSPNESIRSWHRWIPFPTVGFALSSPTENYFIGGGLNLSRGVLAIAGAHFGKVKRLVAGRGQDVAFTILAADDFDIDDITNEGTRTSFFFAVTIDSATIGKLFGGGGGDEEGKGGGKKN